MGAPGFWGDAERAAAVSAEHARAARRLEAFSALQADVDDLDGLVALASEEEALQDEVEEQIASVEARLGELEEQRLFSGRYDAGDAGCRAAPRRRARAARPQRPVLVRERQEVQEVPRGVASAR